MERENYKLYNGDCLEVMDKLIEDNIVFDAIITDLPYGTIKNSWDKIIPFNDMWSRLNKLIKSNGAIVLFGNEPFTSELICSNLKGFKYRWDWNKKIPSGVGYAKYRPMQQTEDISVFTKNGEKTIYNPQMIKREEEIKKLEYEINIVEALLDSLDSRKDNQYRQLVENYYIENKTYTEVMAIINIYNRYHYFELCKKVLNEFLELI